MGRSTFHTDPSTFPFHLWSMSHKKVRFRKNNNNVSKVYFFVIFRSNPPRVTLTLRFTSVVGLFRKPYPSSSHTELFYILITHTSAQPVMASSATVDKSAVNNTSAFKWQSFYGVVSGLSAFVKCVCASLCIGYMLSFSGAAVDLLAVSPGKLMPPNFWIWTILTHSLVEVQPSCVCRAVSLVNVTG